MDDGIEMRIRAWMNMPARPPEPDVMFVRVCHRETWMLTPDGMARTDGGDPGDEAPWSEREDFEDDR